MEGCFMAGFIRSSFVVLRRCLPPGLCALLWLGLLSVSVPRASTALADVAAPAPAAGPQRQRAVSALFQRRCARCHAADGTGKVSPAPDFTQSRWQRRRDDEQLLASILEGKGHKMPSFRGQVSEEGAGELVRLIRTFDPKYDPAAARRDGMSPDEFLRRFHLLQQEMEQLMEESRKSSAPPDKP
jgi:mono/diheme cytochrome c family protein